MRHSSIQYMYSSFCWWSTGNNKTQPCNPGLAFLTAGTVCGTPLYSTCTAHSAGGALETITDTAMEPRFGIPNCWYSVRHSSIQYVYSSFCWWSTGNNKTQLWNPGLAFLIAGTVCGTLLYSTCTAHSAGGALETTTNTAV